MKDYGYPTQLDEIDQWLADNFGILPGACSSTENLRHNTARMIAEVLWPKPLTWQDIKRIVVIADSMLTHTAWDDIEWPDEQKYYEEVLKRFNDERP